MSSPLLDQSQIASRIPHAGGMCLLAAVTFWDADRIVCTATSHRSAAHPLRAHGRLGAAAGIECAAQAMAVHGSLLSGQQAGSQDKPAPGFLASVRAVRFYLRWLDDVAEDLQIVARQTASDAHAIAYSFELRAGGRLLLDGRASVMLSPAAQD